MTKLEDQKRRVLKWLGYTFIISPNSGKEVFSKGGQVLGYIGAFIPESEECRCSVWQEIWGKMDKKTQDLYFRNLTLLLSPNDVATNWAIHTATNKIKWEALNKALEEINKTT